MRAAALIALLLAGCTGGPGATLVPATGAPAQVVTAAPTARPTLQPTASPSATPVPNTVYTADDEEIAKLIVAGADEAIPQLKLLRTMDPDARTDLFQPLSVWITSQKAGIEGFTPSSCTSAAVAAFIDGMDQYDKMREKFLAWRDWGAHRDPFPPGAPGQAVATFEAAVVELEAHCPA
jgi:hypothetical protein